MLALQRRHSTTTRALISASAYADWRGSVPAHIAELRLSPALALAEGTSQRSLARRKGLLGPRHGKIVITFD